MTEVFTSKRKSNKKYILIQLTIALVAIIAFLIYKREDLSRYSSRLSNYIWAIGFILLFLRESLSKRVSKIEFNDEFQQVIFYFDTLFSGTKQLKLDYKDAKLEYANRFAWRGDHLVLYFLTKKADIFKIDRYKDGFSKETLNNIKSTAEGLGLPIRKY